MKKRKARECVRVEMSNPKISDLEFSDLKFFDHD